MRDDILQFPPFILDPKAARLRKGRREIPLQPKEFMLLHHLARNAERLISREELLQTVWPGVTVTAGVLKVRIRQLRRALGDDPEAPRFIETVHGRGYRFIAAVTAAPLPSSASQLTSLEAHHPPSTTQHSVAFVGRAQELADLQGSLEEAVQGRGRIILLTGEPGIGKTRTADELARHAWSRDIPVLFGRCEENEGVPPLWPWTQIMRTYAALVSPKQLQMDLGKGAVDIVQAFPDLQEHWPFPLTRAETKSAEVRFRFFDSFSTFLKTATRRQPLVIILDGLHWADVTSLLLLQFVAPELKAMSLLLVVTYRGVEGGQNPQCSSTLGELARIQGSHSIPLPPFTHDDVARLIQLVMAQEPAPAFVAAIHQQTEGNPFFVTEVVRTYAQEQRDVSAPPSAAEGALLPHRIRDSLTLRLQTLSERCRHMLKCASAMGLEFSLPILEDVGARSQPKLTKKQIARLLKEAESAHFVLAERQGIGRYRFSHALVREVLYSSLDSRKRARLHRCIGEALEREEHNDPRQHVAELALHFFQAAADGEIQKALLYTIRAAERTTALLGYEEAAEYYGKALQLLTLRTDDRQRCEVLIAMGEALQKAGATAAARDSFQQASALARRPAAPELLARAALGFAVGFTGIAVSGGMEDPLVVSLLEEALRGLGKQDSPLRARVLGRLAMELYWSVTQERRNALSQQAVEMARRLGDPATLAYTLNARQVALWGPDNLQERITGAEEMRDLAKQVDDQELALRGQIRLVTGLLERGDLQQADREFMTYVKRAEELRQPAFLWFAATWRGMRCWLRGEFADAERWAREALHIGERAQDPDAAQCYLVQISGFRGAVKSLQDIELPTKDFAERMATIPSWRAGLALLYAGLQQETLARQEFEQMAARDFTDIPRNADWMIALTNLAQVSAYLRDTARAERIYELLLPYADRCLVVGSALLCLGSVTWYLGILATTLERWEEAEAHFATALQRNTQLGAKPMILQTKQRHAMMLLARQRPGDRRRALTLLDEAIDLARAIGMELTLHAMLTLKQQPLQTLQAKKTAVSASTKLTLVPRET